jgi:hypothetical protein
MSDEYSEVELNCKGCMGPCGRCHELTDTDDSILELTELRNELRAVVFRQMLARDERADRKVDTAKADVETLRAALTGLLELGRKDTSNPKYDAYYDAARAAIAKTEAKAPSRN